MNQYPDCPGTPTYRQGAGGKQIKDCSACTYPHDPAHYDAMIDFLKKKLQE
jgi:Zn-finger protein